MLNLYHDTPFHNYQHAFHVFQNCMLFLSNIPELLDSLTSLDAFSLLVAALCHDMDHTGAHPLRRAHTPCAFHCSPVASKVCVTGGVSSSPCGVCALPPPLLP